MASIKLIKASDGTGDASVATIQSVRSAGATTLAVDTVENIPAYFCGSMGTPHTFTDPVTSETITTISEATAVDFEGHVDGSNLEIDTIAPGYTDAGSAVNDIVIIKPTTQYADNLAAVLAVSHDDDGTLKDGAVDSSSVMGTGVVGTTNIANAAVTPEKISVPVWAYLGSAKITGSLTTQSTTPTQATGLTVTATIPTGYTQVRITLSGGTLAVNANSKNLYWSIWRGAVGSGTSVAATQFTQTTANYSIPINLTGLDTPGTGSITYNIGWNTDAGPVTATMGASSTSPVLILVEVC